VLSEGTVLEVTRVERCLFLDVGWKEKMMARMIDQGFGAVHTVEMWLASKERIDGQVDTAIPDLAVRQREVERMSVTGLFDQTTERRKVEFDRRRVRKEAAEKGKCMTSTSFALRIG